MNIINCGTSIGQLAKGVKNTPKIIQRNLKRINKYNTVEFNNLKLHNNYRVDNIINQNMDKFKRTFDNAKTIYYHNCLNLNRKNHINVNIGGDHSISIGSVAASIDKYKDDLFVIWFDAHADINSIEMSKTKNTHGTPLHYLTQSNSYLYESWLHDNQLSFDNLMYIGIRDLDRYEMNVLDKNNIKNINMKLYSQLDLTNLDEHFHDIKNVIGNKKIHLSIDVDGLDPKYISCTGTPVANGIDLDYLLQLITYFRKDIVNVDLVELNLELCPKDEQINSLTNFIKILDRF